MALDPPPQIQLLTPAHAAAYRDVRLEGLNKTRRPSAARLKVKTTNRNPGLQKELRKAISAADKLLGIAGYRRQEGPKHCHKGVLWGMYVRPIARNSRLGRRLVAAVIEHAAGRVEQLTLTVVSENQIARQLYASLGFIEYGRERRGLKLDGRYYDQLLMVRFLAAD